LNLAELLTIPASMYPDQDLLRFESATTTYAELDDDVHRLTGALSGLGVGPGDRVGVIQTNSPHVLRTLFATAALGAVFVPLNYRARADELTHMLRVTEPRVVLAGSRYIPLLQTACESLARVPSVVALDTEAGQEPGFDVLLANGPSVEPSEVADEDLAVMMFTSGTTALPKAVMLDHGALVNFVFGTTDSADGTDRGVVLVSAPLYHIAGLSAVLTATFAGRKIVLQPQFQADEWLRLAESESVTHAFLVPTMLKQVLDSPAFAAANLSTLQVLAYGAAPMPLGVIRRAIEVLPPTVQFINAFGQTETTSTVTVLGPDDHRLTGTAAEIERKVQRLASIGRPLPDVEVAIVDASGASLAAGEVGEIAIRTERVMRGYYGQEEATHATLQDGWLRTRDLGWADEDGYIFLAGRSSDLIIRGGENIAPAEVEHALASHPGVDEVTVVGIPDEEWGERVGAAVVRRPGVDLSPETLIEHARQTLASFKKPELIYFLDELPKNSMGKVLRNELRARFTSASAHGGEHAESRR
jgi:acyl-CoA synthetase (AMP-forming)/AMP-acid ligase II